MGKGVCFIIRIQKYLSECGVCSRRKAEEYLRDGKITVNNETVMEPGTKIAPGKDQVKVNGTLVKPEEVLYYIALNKPKHVISAVTDDRGRTCVTDLIDENIGRVYPVGRLDYDSEGIILLTNDGDFANKLTHPKYHIPKTYLVTVTGSLTEKELDKLKSGVMIDDDYKTQPCQVKIISQTPKTTRLMMTIYEGKNRQIRKMIEVLSHTVIALERISIGNIKLNHLPSGKWRFLTTHEISELRRNFK